METFFTIFVSKFFRLMNQEVENILSKVAQMYLKYGIKSITMDDVARELAISKKTLYQHFENKNDLVNQVIEHEMGKRACEMKEIYSDKLNAIEELLLVNKHLMETIQNVNPSAKYDLKKYYPSLYQKVHTMQREKMYDAILNNIRKGKKEGLFRQELNEETITKVQVAMFENIDETDFIDIDEMRSPDFLRETFIYHIRGMANEKGVQFLENKLREEND